MTITIPTETPAPPAWVAKAGRECLWAWNNSLDWRADAASATTAQYKRQLIKDAKRAYHD